MPFKMLICDDIKYMCQYFKTIFDGLDNFEVVATASTKKEIMGAVSEKKPDVVLLDIQMDTAQTGLDIIPYIKSNAPEAKIIMLTVNEQNSMIYRAIELGADNYVLKTNDINRIIEIVDRTCRGDILLEGTVARKIIEGFSAIKSEQNSFLYITQVLTQLSKTELAIVGLLCRGYTPKEISAERVVEYSTIRSQLTLILKKTGYTNYKTLVNDIKTSGAAELVLSENDEQQNQQH